MKDKASNINWRLSDTMRTLIHQQKEAYSSIKGLRKEQEICEAVRRYKHKHGIK